MAHLQPHHGVRMIFDQLAAARIDLSGQHLGEPGGPEHHRIAALSLVAGQQDGTSGQGGKGSGQGAVVIGTGQDQVAQGDRRGASRVTQCQSPASTEVI